MLKPLAPSLVPKTQDGKVDLVKLKKACAEFESIFINYMLKTMRTTGDENSLLGSSNESQIMNSMFDENLARGIAQGGGIGLADILYNHLKGRDAESGEPSISATNQTGDSSAASAGKLKKSLDLTDMKREKDR